MKAQLTYYCDGGCHGNPGPGGFGVVRVSRVHEPQSVSYMLNYAFKKNFDETTNNRMELEAIIHVLELADKDPMYHYNIISDSAYAVNLCNDWMWKWAENDWTRGARHLPIENLDLIKKIYNLLINLKTTITISKCSGHSDILENELADALAADNDKKFNDLIKKYNITILDF